MPALLLRIMGCLMLALKIEAWEKQVARIKRAEKKKTRPLFSSREAAS